MAGNILSPEEHRQLTTIPTEIDEAKLVPEMSARKNGADAV